MFPQHTREYLQVVANCNESLQSAIDSVLDSAQRRDQQSVGKEAGINYYLLKQIQN